MDNYWLTYNGVTLVKNGYGVNITSNPPYVQLGLHLHCDGGNNVLKIRYMRYRMFDSSSWQHVVAKRTYYDNFNYRSCYSRSGSGWTNLTTEQLATISSGSEFILSCEYLNIAIDLRYKPVQFSFDYGISGGGRNDDVSVNLWGQNPLSGSSSTLLGQATVVPFGQYQNLTLNLQ